jgi:hypothetical protein
VGCFAPANLGKDQLRPYLGYSNLGMELSDVNSNYNSQQATLTKRAGFVTAQIAYTYSKAMGDGGGAGDAYNENPEPECPFTCLVSTVSNPVIVTGGNANGIGGTQSGGVVESWQKYDYAKLSFDAPHIVAVSFTVESPWGKSFWGCRRSGRKRMVFEFDCALPERFAFHRKRHGSPGRIHFGHHDQPSSQFCARPADSI